MAAYKLRADSKSLYENQILADNVLSNDLGATTVTQVRLGTGDFVPVGGSGVTIAGTFGVLKIMPDGSYNYDASTSGAERLATGVKGIDTFTYAAVNSAGKSATTTLTFTLTGRNDAPELVASNVTLNSLNEDQTDNAGQTVSEFLSSTDVDSAAQSGIAISGLASGNGSWQYSLNGGVSWSGIGTVSSSSALLLRSSDLVRFVPDGAQGTAASFTYRAWDQSSGSAGTKADANFGGGETAFSSAVVSASINVTSVNDAPLAADDSVVTAVNTPVLVDVLVNDRDVDGGTLAIAAFQQPINGTTAIQDGRILYTPNGGFAGSDTFQYTVADGQGGSAVATASVAVGTTNAAPVAVDDLATTLMDTSVLIDVLSNDRDSDNDALAISALGSAANGQIVLDNGQVRYAPNTGFTGLDSFTYTVADGRGGSDVGSVSVSVGSSTSAASAVTVSFRQGANGYTGTIDTMIKQYKPTLAYGNAITVGPDADWNAGRVQGLLSFSNLFGSATGQVPVGATILSATLMLQTTNPTSNAGALYQMSTPWSGASTWDGLGGGVQVGSEASASGVALGAATIGARSYDVTASVRGWYEAGTTSTAQNAANLGWLLDPGSTDGWDFGSSESAFRPSLVISYVPAGSSNISPTLPTASIAGPTAASRPLEGGKIAFTITLNQAATQNVTVSFATADGTARAGSDYLAAAGAIEFLAGETSKVVQVQTTSDSIGERPESFSVQITSAINARVTNPFSTAVITDDDVQTAAMPAVSAGVIAVRSIANGSIYQDGSGGKYGISDPSAIAYIPGLNVLYVGDSEHDESPFYSATNMFSLRTDGSFVRNYSLTAYTKEPTGLAYNSNNGLLYVADDDAHGIFWSDPLNPSVKLGYFDTRPLGFLDTEDLKIDPVTGHIHVLDGSLRQLFEMTIDGKYVDAIPLPSIMKDAEALAYHPTFDLFFVGSGASTLIWVMDRAGNIKATLDVLTGYTPTIKGLELAPSSDPNDGNKLSLYVADYGVDQVNDGRLIEVTLGADWLMWT
jgi:VCBS repeat-containing protein